MSEAILTVRALVAVALLLASMSPVWAAIQFPGSQTEGASPDRRWVLRWIPADETRSGLHELVLRNVTSGAVRKVLEFGRSVSISWAPDSQRFAVVDRAGSDTAESWVYQVQTGARLCVSEAIEAQHRGALAFTAGAHHLYFEADRWLDDVTVSVRVWGYGGPQAFNRRIRLTVRK